jgi:hypothetical protein
MVTVLLSLGDARDIIIIAAGSLLILLLLAAFIFTVVLGLATRALIGAVRALLRDEVTPLLQQARQTVRRFQGTATFISENAVGPVIRVYGIFAGTRRLFGVLSGVSGRTRKKS